MEMGQLERISEVFLVVWVLSRENGSLGIIVGKSIEYWL